jgi:N-acetylglutamate synthase
VQGPSPGRTPDLVRGLQERAARALPAELIQPLGTWLLRYSPGCAWWVGSVLPHGEATEEALSLLLAAAEEFYAGRAGETVFQVTPGACPARLDATLEQHRYRRHTPMSLQAAPVTEVLAWSPSGLWDVRVTDVPEEAWWAVWRSGIHHGEGAHRHSEQALLGRVASPSAFAAACVGGEPVSIGRIVADTGWAGVFDVVTLPHARGRGASHAVLAVLASWARTRGCEGLYLQVERDNAAALKLYGKAGFEEVGRYHYRERP